MRESSEQVDYLKNRLSMIKDELTPLVTGSHEQAKEALHELYQRAKKICDDYWSVFRENNLSQYNIPSDQRLIGRFGPNVQLHKLNEKVYIEWRSYAPSRPGKREKIHGVRVRPRRGLNYLPSQFIKATPWELKMIVEAEEKFKLLRQLIEIFHGVNKGLKKYRLSESEEIRAGELQ